jgi:hypothetical protein
MKHSPRKKVCLSTERDAAELLQLCWWMLASLSKVIKLHLKLSSLSPENKNWSTAKGKTSL